MAGNSVKLGIVVLVIVILAALAIGIAGNASMAQSTGATPLLLTDPPQVPSGTTSLTIAYSSLMVEVNGAAGQQWITANGSGTIDLMQLINVSEVIGAANLPSNSTVEAVRFTVTSSNITVGNRTSSVLLSNSTIVAKVVGSRDVNSTSGVLLDFTPTVAAIYTGNSTVFVMVPSVRAIVVGNQRFSPYYRIRSRQYIEAKYKQRLAVSGSNLTIGASSLAVSGNQTSFSVTVTDNSNSSLQLNGIMLFGNYTVSVMPPEHERPMIRIGAGGFINGNTTGLDSQAQASVSEGLFIQRIHEFGFIIGSNGTLALPFSWVSYGRGYVLQPGSSETFSFNGNISYGSGRLTMAPVAGDTYKVVVLGSNFATAYANVKAT